MLRNRNPSTSFTYIYLLWVIEMKGVLINFKDYNSISPTNVIEPN